MGSVVTIGNAAPEMPTTTSTRSPGLMRVPTPEMYETSSDMARRPGSSRRAMSGLTVVVENALPSTSWPLVSWVVTVRPMTSLVRV